MKAKIVKSSQLGSNCWRPERFTGGECQRILPRHAKGKCVYKGCTYPEKKSCKAYQTYTVTIRKTVKAIAEETG